jgi:CheY-like chemotaxis protein
VKLAGRVGGFAPTLVGSLRGWSVDEAADVVARILIVDDEPDQRFLLRWWLERAGHEVIEAAHGRAALSAVRQAPPDLVVSDLQMPVMDGTEMILQLRADAATAHIPILVVSGTPDPAIPADAVISKADSVDDVVEAANMLLARKGERE